MFCYHYLVTVCSSYCKADMNPFCISDSVIYGLYNKLIKICILLDKMKILDGFLCRSDIDICGFSFTMLGVEETSNHFVQLFTAESTGDDNGSKLKS